MAVVSEIIAAFSQVSLVIGCGSSCSQTLLAKRPSYTFGSAANAISIPCSARGVAIRGVTACASAFPSTVRPVSTAAAVPGTMPSASQRSQLPSKSPGALPWACQNRRSSSWAPTSPSPTNAASTSASWTPPHSGAISGCTIDTVPSVARRSPHDSSGCAAGTMVLQAAAVSSS